MNSTAGSRTGGELPPFALLEAVRRLRTFQTDGESWLQPALLSAAQTLRAGLTAGTADPDTAPLFARPDPGLVETWLETFIATVAAIR